MPHPGSEEILRGVGPEGTAPGDEHRGLPKPSLSLLPEFAEDRLSGEPSGHHARLFRDARLRATRAGGRPRHRQKCGGAVDGCSARLYLSRGNRSLLRAVY